jgi:hypothetical protein
VANGTLFHTIGLLCDSQGEMKILLRVRPAVEAILLAMGLPRIDIYNQDAYVTTHRRCAHPTGGEKEGLVEAGRVAKSKLVRNNLIANKKVLGGI